MRSAAVLLAAAVAAGAAGAGTAVSGTANRGFAGEIRPVRWADVRHSYRSGCPVPPAHLRTLRVSYWDFDGRPQTGSIVVARRHARAIVLVFQRLWDARFPIRRMRPVSAYRGSDDASMAADNTSGFNCRLVGGTSRWSMHAYGEAIDVNPVENPYLRGEYVSPPAGRAFVDRSRYRKGMAMEDGVLVRAFAAGGWRWGGSWGDYQHFSTNGR
ncbi:MAG: M15 family metallopeptidase [Actinomycetota bacterium]|nr:M15 family metallopeptidase [Actinomycetota bacterium]